MNIVLHEFAHKLDMARRPRPTAARRCRLAIARRTTGAGDSRIGPTSASATALDRRRDRPGLDRLCRGEPGRVLCGGRARRSSCNRRDRRGLRGVTAICARSTARIR
ncbi:MAG: zinc-dependent peptidase [Comamonadaceae bacterium]|nr:zinc-dependent peptidase [Comamonadaceae bacterium]